MEKDEDVGKKRKLTGLGDGLSRVVFELVGVISLPAAVLGVVAAFLGWRAASAYFSTFGIGLEWSTTSILDLVLVGWVEALLLLALVAFYLSSLPIISPLVRILPFRVSLVALLLFFGGTMALFIMSAYRMVYFQKDITFTEYAFARGGLVLLWWLFSALFMKIPEAKSIKLTRTEKRIKETITRLSTFRIGFLMITAVLTASYVVYFASVRGTYLAVRDLSSSSHLSYVTIISNTPLGISEEKINRQDDDIFYEYKDLRMIVKMDDFIFVVRPEEVDLLISGAKVYIIPLSLVRSLSIQQWYFDPNVTVPSILKPTATP